MVDEDDKLLTPLDASLYLGFTAELLFQFTKHNFPKTSGLRSLQTKEYEGKTRYSERELKEFNKLLEGYWCGPNESRPSIPKAILDHLRAESQNQCARCGSGIGVDTAHIVPWSVSRSHHPHNLIRICSSCHREHDVQQSLPTEELKKIKQRLIDRTCSRLKSRIQSPVSRLRPPRQSKQFFGREIQLDALTNALQLGESVILSGIGGIGKSELLLQAFNRIESGRTVLWCNVEEYRTVTELIMVLRNALLDDGTACSEEKLPSNLDDIQACVVFDGIEQSNLDRLDEFEDAVTKLQRDTLYTQFVITSQILLYRFSADTTLRLKGLDESASQLLFNEICASYDEGNKNLCETELLQFCDGHPLAIQFAGILAVHYGSAANAMAAIRKNGTKSIRLPGRKHHSRQTSLELCLQTAYSTLSQDSRKLIWSLALAPAGLFSHYIDHKWIDIDDTTEALASLRLWHFIDVTPINKKLSRIRLLAPIRQYVTDRGRSDELELFEQVVHSTVEAFGMMVAVLELNYDTPENTPQVMQRYEVELPNFLNALELARARGKNRELVKTSITITRSLMRYFFVSRMPEQGAQVMLEATELALCSENFETAPSLIMLFMSLASRSVEVSLISKGLDLVDRIENIIDSEEGLPDLAMSRAIAAQTLGDFSSAEQLSRKAFEGYCKKLRSAKETDQPEDGNQDLHNDISNALGILGYSLLSQKRYREAAKAYRHSLNHERGASIGVNRGQTLHQIGNCEAYQGNYKAAAKLYFDAAKIFHYVGMEEYLGNAFGELGYTLLDDYQHKILAQLSEELVDSALLDLSKDIQRIFNPARSLDHQQCIEIIRKTFGAVILVSFAEQGDKLMAFSIDLANSTVAEFGEQIDTGTRDQDEFFPLEIINSIFHLGALIAQGELDLEQTGDISRETTGEFLRVACETHDWAHDVMRLTDWLSIYFTRRWGYKEITASRLREFIENYRDDIEDYIDLER
ncbi:MAG: hypothetical protein GY820_07490 [Gammaproteobacteria bacterium]|nr:hypothetical protein [Gammaproteobacteria bacterium]